MDDVNIDDMTMDDKLSMFKQEMLNLLEFLMDTVKIQEHELLQLRSAIDIELVSKYDLVYYFITLIIPYKKQILLKNELFFLDSDDWIKIKTNENKKRIEERFRVFKTLWRSEKMTPEYKEVAWDFLASLIYIAESIKKKQ